MNRDAHLKSGSSGEPADELPDHSPYKQFRNAIDGAGLIPPADIKADGKVHRFSSTGVPGKRYGWYVLDCSGIPAGMFGDSAFGCSKTWRADLDEWMDQRLTMDRKGKVTQ